MDIPPRAGAVGYAGPALGVPADEDGDGVTAAPETTASPNSRYARSETEVPTNRLFVAVGRLGSGQCLVGIAVRDAGRAVVREAVDVFTRLGRPA